MEGGKRKALCMHNLRARWGWVLNAMPQLLYPHPRDPVPIVQDGCGPWGWSGQCGNLTPTGI